MSLSGIMFALAAYSYPAGRLHAPLIMIVLTLFLLVNKKLKIGPCLLMGIFAFIAVIPIVNMIFTGELMGRGSIVGIYTEHYLRGLGKEQTFLSIAEIFFKHFFKHLSLDFLVLKGDRILRHHSGFGGQLGWLEIFGILLYPIIVIRLFYKNKSIGFCKDWAWAPLFLFFCLLVCFVPAAFTWDSIPHALRSIPGWTFTTLLAGISVNYISEFGKKYCLILILLGICYFSLYVNDYVREFPKRSAIWFDIGDNQEGRRRAAEDDWQSAIDKYKAKPHENYLTHMRYWMIAYGDYSCKESQKVFGLSS